MNTIFREDKETILENVQCLDAAFDLNHEARMVSYRFLSVVDERMEELGWISSSLLMLWEHPKVTSHSCLMNHAF